MLRVMPETRGRGTESTVRSWDGTRNASGLPGKIREIGEPCAPKGACTVRKGGGEKRAAPGNHLRGYLSGWSRTGLSRYSYGSKCNGTSLAAYFTEKCSHSSAKRPEVGNLCAPSRRTDLGLRLHTGHRSLLSTARRRSSSSN